MTEPAELDYATLIRKLTLPADFVAPVELRHENVVAQALTRKHFVDDVRGINASIELMCRTRGVAGRRGQ